ncbi:Yippee family putative zinc-binding protein [Actinidia rufa]|uniref:Yippee family putative zinc-binding protein n=1 Tax=Actinidia rufa TaxID=165716 RepID=A0A7J0EB41_9ERIC|nr:Yippee family putative zinc-binding protein [Actinidia rufa]
MMMTGLHTVADIFCVGCGSNLGWKYEFAHEKSQKYKEGKTVLERFKISGPDGNYWANHEAHAGGSDADDVVDGCVIDGCSWWWSCLPDRWKWDRASLGGHMKWEAAVSLKLRSMSSRRRKKRSSRCFLEMRKHEKEQDDLFLQNSEDFGDPLGLKQNTSPTFNITSSTTARKTATDDFLNSDNDKNDYDWLLAPPGTPLFPSLEMESQRTVMNLIGSPKARPTALKSRVRVII